MSKFGLLIEAPGRDSFPQRSNLGSRSTRVSVRFPELQRPSIDFQPQFDCEKITRRAPNDVFQAQLSSKETAVSSIAIQRLRRRRHSFWLNFAEETTEKDPRSKRFAQSRSGFIADLDLGSFLLCGAPQTHPNHHHKIIDSTQ